MKQFLGYEPLRLRTLQAGEILFHEGDVGDFAYIIERGEIEISRTVDQKKIVLICLGPGNLFGELALVDGRPRSASAIALTETLLTVVSKEQVERRIEEADPILRMLLLVVMRYFRLETLRLREQQEEVKHLTGQEPPPEVMDRIAEAVDLIRLENELRLGIADEQFILHYQPIVNLHTGAIAGFEALVRWFSPQRGFVRPDQFIALAESTSLIVPLGYWIMETACGDLHHLQNHCPHPLFVSINIASRQIEDTDFITALVHATTKAGVNPHQVKLEILERSLFDNAIAQDWVKCCRELAFPLVLDDFGTGYSSLSYLKDFPVNTLKIDRAFIQDLEDDRNSRSICQALIHLAQSLGIEVVAEGIETQGQWQILREMGCDYGQGYLFSRPVDFDKACHLLQQQHPQDPPPMP